MDRVQRLRELHRGPRLLVLPNAWDAVSAALFEKAGARAIATSSGAVAWALGYADGEQAPPEEMLAAVSRIVRVVSVPVTADLEAGYGDPVATAEAAVAAGAAGLNLEDGAGDPAEQVERLRAVREAVADRLVLNARIDVFLRHAGRRWDRFDDAVARAGAYLAAGADCVFPIGVSDAELIRRLVEEIDGPVNILATSGSPTVAELERLGVRRVSVGSGIAQAALGTADRAARELLEDGTLSFLEGRIPGDELNRLLG
ncbi:MAG: isocitrate lyase/phosphoenolpyruvate mutase family protein [Gaiellaceae bacterium]